jgi:hypothetical protein
VDKRRADGPDDDRMDPRCDGGESVERWSNAGHVEWSNGGPMGRMTTGSTRDVAHCDSAFLHFWLTTI